MRTKMLLGALVLGVGLLLGGSSTSEAGWYPYCGPRVAVGYAPYYRAYYRPYYHPYGPYAYYRPYAFAPYYARAHYYRPHAHFRVAFGW